MLVSKDHPPAKYVLKLTDFGFARCVSKTAGAFSATMCGTANWMAPEVRPDSLGDVRYNKECDVFSAGLVDLSLVDLIPDELLEVFMGIAAFFNP